MRYDELVEALRAAAGPLPVEPPAYVDKILRHAYKVTDADVESLNLTEDEIFDVTVAAAVEAGLIRYRRGMELLG